MLRKGSDFLIFLYKSPSNSYLTLMKCYQILWRVYLRGRPHKRQFKEGAENGVSCRGSGCPRKTFFPFFTRRLRRREEKDEQGTPLQPRQGALPLESRLG